MLALLASYAGRLAQVVSDLLRFAFVKDCAATFTGHCSCLLSALAFESTTVFPQTIAAWTESAFRLLRDVKARGAHV